jgi:hypothetical protein
MHSLFSAIIASSSLATIKDKDIFSNYSANIEALSVAFPASILNPARAVDRFSTVLSTSARSLP